MLGLSHGGRISLLALGSPSAGSTACAGGTSDALLRDADPGMLILGLLFPGMLIPRRLTTGMLSQGC